MKKFALISVVLFLLLANIGCEDREDDPLGPYPTDVDGIISRFIEKGWEAYNDGEYNLAYARFDSVVRLDAGNADAYVGLGYANIQLGADDPGKFETAKSSFGFVPTVEGGSPIVEVVDGDVSWGQVADTLFSLGVEPSMTPILGVMEPVVEFTPGPGAPPDVSEQELTVRRITDNTFVTTPTYYDDGTTIYIPGPDGDFDVDFTYYSGDQTHTLALAFAGYAQATQLQGKSDPEELLESIIYARTVLEEFDEDDNPLRDENTTTIPDYVDPNITSRNVRILLAQSYFYYGYLYNCMWELWELDPTLMNTLDPDAPSFERDLQEALEDIY